MLAVCVTAFLICIGLWVWLQPAPPDLPTLDQRGSPPAAFIPGGPSCNPRPINPRAASQTVREAAYRCAEAAEAARMQSEDLTQQRRSADAAMATARAAYDQSRILLIGTIFGGLTLLAAGAAAFYARVAAMSARQQLLDARLSASPEVDGEASLHISVHRNAADEPVGEMADVQFGIINLGSVELRHLRFTDPVVTVEGFPAFVLKIGGGVAPDGYLERVPPNVDLGRNGGGLSASGLHTLPVQGIADHSLNGLDCRIEFTVTFQNGFGQAHRQNIQLSGLTRIVDMNSGRVSLNARTTPAHQL